MGFRDITNVDPTVSRRNKGVGSLKLRELVFDHGVIPEFSRRLECVESHFVDNRLRYKLRVTFKIKYTVLIITYAKDPRRIEDGDIPADF
jgi:hypothetical protein